MDKFLNLVNSLPKDQKDIFYKLMGALSACRVDVEEKIQFIEEKQIKLETAKALVRVFSMDVKDIKARYKLYQESNLEYLVLSDPEILRYYPSKVISRVKACDKVGKPIYVRDKLAPFLFDDEQWNALKVAIVGEANEFQNTIDQRVSEPAIVDPTSWLNNGGFVSEEPYDLDLMAFKRYEKLSRIIDNVQASLGISRMTTISNLTSGDYLMKEVSSNPEKSDRDIIRGCLAECCGINEIDDNLLSEYMEKEVEQEKKRGL